MPESGDSAAHNGMHRRPFTLAAEFEGEKVDTVIGIEARGFIFAPSLTILNTGKTL
jgi:adenine/guanine phosphoribosyltransferase-like PRPP-binding protein